MTVSATRLPVAIVGLGAHLPATVVTNDDLAERYDTSDEWIASRTGIRQRHWAAPDEATSDLATAAAAKALAAAGIAASELCAIVVCTTSPDHQMPGTAPQVAANLGVQTAAAFDLQAACTGFLYGLQVVGSMVAMQQRPALLIGAETLSRFLNHDDRTTAVLFGDGAGAVVLAPAMPNAPGQEALGPFATGADGDLGPILWFEAGGSRIPSTPQTTSDNRHLISMQGGEVYRHAVERMTASCTQVLQDAGLTLDDIDLVVAHQANVRIIDAVAKRLGAPGTSEPGSKFHVTVDIHGNTSAASIPLALADAAAKGLLHPGDQVLLTAFGSGLTFGAALVTWSI
jgi:3-oxoacyl-[acyl-carrier-protein] synthase-3